MHWVAYQPSAQLTGSCAAETSLNVQVFDDPKKKRNLILVLGVTLGLFIIYLLAQRARKQ